MTTDKQAPPRPAPPYDAELADWLGTESALVFTTGHQANIGALGTILGPSDTVIVDSGDHASIMDGCLLSRSKLRAFRHNRLDRLEKTLEKAAAEIGFKIAILGSTLARCNKMASIASGMPWPLILSEP